MNRRSTLALLLALALAAPAGAAACSYIPDPRPLAERLAEAPVAFVGTVLEITPAGETRFAVELWLGAGRPEHMVLTPLPRSSCALKFLPGQRWLYAGPLVTDPSRLLAEPAGPGSARATPQ